ncbi:MAG: hypothetical protein ACEQSL_09740 [Sediminibacterium sp.]
MTSLINAQPNPYKRGTKKSKQGMALVGEEGPEFMYLPQGAKILSNKKTNQYENILDAMYDGNLNDVLKKLYIAPALKAQQKLYDIQKQESFAQNIANSFMLNNNGGVTANDLDWIRRQGTYIRNGEAIAELIADKISKKIPQTSRRYN